MNSKRLNGSVKWINSEVFSHFFPHGKPGHHIVLHRLHEKEQDNQWLTVIGDRYYIWLSEDGEMRWESMNTNFDIIYKEWKKIVQEVPKIEMGHDGFYVLNGRAVSLGTKIDIIPTMIYSGLTSDTWMVLLHYNGTWEPCRFTVYGEERVRWMHTHAHLDQHLTIKFNKYHFERCVE